jgi:DNA-binding PadR family transcriptional regulator
METNTQVEQRINLRSMRLAKRDRTVLEFMWENGFADAELVRDYFFKGQNNRHHYRLLKRLKEKGLIDVLSVSSSFRRIHRLSEKGINFLKMNSPDLSERRTRPPYFRDTFLHDSTLIRLRQILLSSQLISNYRNEQQLKSEFARTNIRAFRDLKKLKVPDAVFLLKTLNRSFVVALELEIAHKSQIRYDEMVRRLCLSPDFNAVFIVAASEIIKQTIALTLKKLRETNPVVMNSPRLIPFYYVGLSNLLEKGNDAEFQSENSRFTLNALLREIQEQGDKHVD